MLIQNIKLTFFELHFGLTAKIIHFYSCSGKSFEHIASSLDDCNDLRFFLVVDLWIKWKRKVIYHWYRQHIDDWYRGLLYRYKRYNSSWKEYSTRSIGSGFISIYLNTFCLITNYLSSTNRDFASWFSGIARQSLGKWCARIQHLKTHQGAVNPDWVSIRIELIPVL